MAQRPQWIKIPNLAASYQLGSGRAFKSARSELNSVRLHGGEFITGRITEVKASATRKAEGRSCDNPARTLDEFFSIFERFDLNNGKRSARCFLGIALKPEVDVTRHRARIRRSKVRHRKAERTGVKGFRGARGSYGKFDEANSIGHWHALLLVAAPRSLAAATPKY